MPYGLQTISGSKVLPTRVSVDHNPHYKVGGVTIDWSTVTAASGTPTTLPDGSVIEANVQFLRYGQVLCRISDDAEVQHIVIANATGGTYRLGFNGVLSAPIAYNGHESDIQAALEGVEGIGPGNVSVAAGSANKFDVTFNAKFGNVPQMTSDASALIGSNPSVTITTTTAGTANNNKFGPYDNAASNGQQTMTRGDIYILNQTVVKAPAGSPVQTNDIQGNVIEGGRVWASRIMNNGGTSGTKAAGPKLVDLLAAMPTLELVKD